MTDGDGTEDPRCGFWIDSMDHPCQRRVDSRGDLCHQHPPDTLEEQPRCGFQKEDGEYCRQMVPQDQPGGFCYMHPLEEKGVPDGHGASEGNDFAKGNSGGDGAPEGNVRAMKHGLHMTAERLLEVMDPEEREEFKHRFLEYREKCMNQSQAMSLAAAAVLRNRIFTELFDGGLTREVYTDDGTPYDQFKKDDIQALQGFFREIRLGLHYEGNSAQHTGGGGSGHDNLDALVQDAD